MSPMAIQMSPGVVTREYSLAQIIPQVSVSAGAFVGQFAWGPLEFISVLATETDLVNAYGQPTDDNFTFWFSAQNFLSYSSNLNVLRVVGNGASNGNDSTVTLSSPLVIKNKNDWQDNYSAPSENSFGQFAGKYPGEYANGIEVHMADSATFSSVQSTSIINEGTGYTTASDDGRSVTFSSPSSGTTATGTLIVTSDVVTGIDVVDKGVGYRHPPTVTIPPPLSSNSSQATATAAFANQAVTSLTKVSGGSGYTGVETVVFQAPSKINSNAEINITSVNSGAITGILLTNGGYGYVTGTIAVTGGGGNATVDITAVNGVVTAAVLDQAGSGYSVTNNVSLATPTLTVSTATATMTFSGGAVTGFTMINHGYGYAGTESFFIQPPATLSAITATATSDLWPYYDEFLSDPGTTTYTKNKNGSNDGLHIVLVDGSGLISGSKGTILERYAFCSKAVDATYNDGTSAYYPYVLRDQSQYVWFGAYPTAMDEGVGAWGSTAQGTSFNPLVTPVLVTIANGTNGSAVTNEQLIPGWEMFNDPQTVDVGLLISGPADRVLQEYVIQNVAEIRMDAIGFISPEALETGSISNAVINNKGYELESVMNNRDVLTSSSYGVMDCNWKYQYDAYNDTYRWVPLNGDIAGLCARTDATNDPWWSPAGFTRGQIKNCVKLAWNPIKTDRDELFPNGINPVVTMLGEGTVLYGDKTMLSQPDAFDHINVRRLFIVLEKAISLAAKYQLFEFNDDFTRLKFIQMVNPYLRDIQGRRGITDFLVVCDTTNNTPDVIDNNAFVGDIYVKPTRSINYITLDFIATPTGLDFTTAVAQFTNA